MINSDFQLLNLLAVGLGHKEPDVSLFSGQVDWKYIYQQARRQTVMGIVFDGLLKLPKELQPPKDVFLQWYSVVLQIEKANCYLNDVLADVVQRYREGGFEPVLLKGQGLAQYYPKPLHRQPGDIDLYFDKNNEQADRLAQSWGNHFETDPKHHTAYFYRKIEIENHWEYVFFYSEKNTQAWNNWMRNRALSGEETLLMGDSRILVPEPTVNAVYVLLHLLHHFLYVGVGFRQVCDWIQLLERRSAAIDRKAIAELLDVLPIGRVVAALSYVAVTYLGMSKEVCLVDVDTPEAKKYGEIMLRDILKMGNFGHDTAVGHSFKKGRLWRNLKAYVLAASRQARLYGFFPSEVKAYPLYWVKEHLLKH